MPRPAERTRSRKRVTKPLPGGRTGTVFKGEMGAVLRCSICGQRLSGVSNTSKTKGLNRSRKRIWRPYGGQLCHNCLKTAFRQAVRTA